MIIICTGQSGLGKKEYLKEVQNIANKNGESLEIINVRDFMYEIGAVRPGTILEKPLYVLNLLAKEACKQIKEKIVKEKIENVIINAHATFRWNRGLFVGLYYQFIKDLKPDVYITLIDNVDIIKKAMYLKDKKYKFKHRKYSYKDIMVWREEEILATKILANIDQKHHYLIAKKHNPELIFKLLFKQKIPKVYASFPISQVKNDKNVLTKIDKFKEELNKKFIVFDPITISEGLYKNGKLKSIKGDIEDQIISRDFMLIDQSDMVITFVASHKRTGYPIHSAGCQRELAYGRDNSKYVFVIWDPDRKKFSPGPFERDVANKIFYSLEEASIGISKYIRSNHI